MVCEMLLFQSKSFKDTRLSLSSYSDEMQSEGLKTGLYKGVYVQARRMHEGICVNLIPYNTKFSRCLIFTVSLKL